MRENFLYYLWKYKKIAQDQLKTTRGSSLRIIDFGEVNTNAGPDIINARICIGEIFWAGNIEFHSLASHWNIHGHHHDPAYNNVILHVVWENDIEIYMENGSPIPVLELRTLVPENVLEDYNAFFMRPLKWINCERHLKYLEEEEVVRWTEDLFKARLNKKLDSLMTWHNQLGKDWEALTFLMISRYLGGPVNADAFHSWAMSFKFNLVLKLRDDPMVLESLFYGQANLLNNECKDDYVIQLINQYNFLTNKYKLNNDHLIRFRFLRLRPSGFPTLRLSQLAQLYNRTTALFETIVQTRQSDSLYQIFRIKSSTYWSLHYTFGKETKFSEKWLSKRMALNLIVNVVIPLKFAYSVYNGNSNWNEILRFARSLKAENNAVIRGFKKIGINTSDAVSSQGFLELKANYCDKNKCLQCRFGHLILNENM
ncbi:MAG: DUF2851 family protein [Bacteroidia bacterium]|nr:DUF2851 family protein [Bacteroidia bacterium]NNL80406.1 DUF2851 family protein [Flavobacteriaceae bacterium]